jgi:hypothetical protein
MIVSLHILAISSKIDSRVFTTITSQEVAKCKKHVQPVGPNILAMQESQKQKKRPPKRHRPGSLSVVCNH